MKLTNSYRDQFVDAVMSAVPWLTTMTATKFVEEVEQRAMDALPEEVRELSKKYPEMLNMVDCSHRFEHAGRTSWAYIVRPVMINFEKLNLKAIVKARYENEKESDQRQETARKLRAIAGSCSTLSKLRLALPDLVSYMPEEVGDVRCSTALVDPSVMKTLKESGLPIPKGAKA